MNPRSVTNGSYVESQVDQLIPRPSSGDGGIRASCGGGNASDTGGCGYKSGKECFLFLINTKNMKNQ